MTPDTRSQFLDGRLSVATLANLNAAQARDYLIERNCSLLRIRQAGMSTPAALGCANRLLHQPRFVSAFHGAPARIAQDLAAYLGQLGVFDASGARFVADTTRVCAFMAGLSEDRPAEVFLRMRNWFAPGDLMWHVDTATGRFCFRLVWCFNRADGTHFTPTANVRKDLLTAFYHRHGQYLKNLDRATFFSGVPFQLLANDEPGLLHSLIGGHREVLKDPRLTMRTSPDWATIHRVWTPTSSGTFHRASVLNTRAPGLQLIVTVVVTP